MNKKNNVKRKAHFNQVCVWPGVNLGGETAKSFVQYFKEEMNVRVQYLETVTTLPDKKNGRYVRDTGGRTDIFFAVHDNDIASFAIPRLKRGIRWIEDVLSPSNYTNPIYPERVFEYKTWAVSTEA